MMAVILVFAAQSLRQFGQHIGIIERSPPSKPTCLSVSANTVKISWTTVQYEARPTCYKILVRRNLNEEWIESISHLEGDDLQTTIKDLMYDTKYQFQVSAVYEDGISGPFSEPSESVTTEKIPTAAPTFVSSDPNEITISWCMVQPGPEPTYFQIRQEEESNNEWFESTFDNSYEKNHATIHNLNFDTRYKFQIRAVYENGDKSSYSETSEAMCTKRPSPCVTVLELIKANSIVIKWTTDQQDIKPAYYLVRQKLIPSSEWVESIFDETGTKMQTIIHNLKFNSQYQFQVRSVYPDGEMSPFSEASLPIKTEPSPPTAPVCTSVHANQIVLSWSMIDQRAKPIGFEIRHKEEPEGEWVESTFEAEAEKMQMTIHSLKYYAKYHFQVRALYDDGIKSPYSESSEGILTERPPPFEVTCVSVNGNTIQLSWSRVQRDAEPSYYRVRQKLTSDTEWIESTFDETGNKMRATIHNLKFDSHYQFQVRSVYSDGEMSPFSEFSLPIKTEPSPPSAPACTSVHANQIVLSWSMLDQRAKPIGFEIRHKEISEDEWVESTFEAEAEKMQVTIHSLKYYAKYHFQVRALYDDGIKSPYSESSEGILTERPPPFEVTCVSVNGNTIQLSWSRVQRDAEPSYYRVRQKLTSDTGWIESTFDETGNKMQATIHNLKFDSEYQFQVCSVYLGGEVSSFSDCNLPIKTKRPPPNAPVCMSIQQNAITLSWSMIQEAAEPFAFEIRQKEESDSKWVESKLYSENKMQATVQNLKYNTQYRFQVRAIYTNYEVSSYSEPSIPITSGQSPAANIIPLCTPATGKSQHPRQYNLPVFEDECFRDASKMTRKTVVASGQLPAMEAEAEEKLILMVGKHGAGKSALIDGLANYLNGVVWEDDFRFRLTGTFKEKHSTSETTEWITSYTMSQNGSQSFILTIIDTPGFDDCGGSKRDEELVGRIQSFFPELRQQGKGTIDAVCFVTPSQITNQQTNIFNFMLSLFGKDIKDNIVVMATFADENKPPVKESLRNADVPYTKMFKFNNGCLFENNSQNTDPVNLLNWSMNMRSFHKFISYLLQMPKRSLHLTTRVLDNRAIITTIISGLHPLISEGLEDMKIINTEKGLMKKFEKEISQNKRFSYTITVNKQIESDLEEGTHVTNCLVCKFTCHYPCAIPENESKASCASMEDNYCTKCPKKCHWQHHKNNGYKIEWYQDEEEFTDEDMKQKYDIAIHGKNTKEDFIRELENAYKTKRNRVHAMLEKVLECKKFLTKNALKDSTLTAVTSIDLMIQTENEEKKPGYTERVELLKEFKQEAEMLEKEGNI